jgi:hypothetical protein
MAGFIELPGWINETTVERAYARAQSAQRERDEGLAECGLRAAVVRDPRMMLALEKGAEVLKAMEERQRGRTKRDSGTPFGYRVELTEVGLWRTAYETADKGLGYNALFPYKWMLAGAATLAGLRP